MNMMFRGVSEISYVFRPSKVVFEKPSVKWHVIELEVYFQEDFCRTNLQVRYSNSTIEHCSKQR